jgi:nickel/cobalt exporter
MRRGGGRGVGRMTLEAALVGTAITIAALHACAPDHWAPFAALARAERWSARRTAVITSACGFGHVTASVALALLALLFGLEIVEAFGERLESMSGLLLIGFGVAYAAWGLRSAVSARLHAHAHAHGRPHAHFHSHSHSVQLSTLPSDDSPPRHMTAWTLFLLFSADTCVAVIPLMFASVPLGWRTTAAVVVAYETATIGTMVLLVLPARAAARAVRGRWADQYGDALAGGVIALVGTAVVSLGI